MIQVVNDKYVIFLQPYRVPSQPTTTQRQNSFNQLLPPPAGLWVLMHSCMTSDRHGYERWRGQEITLAVIHAPPCSYHKTRAPACMDGRRVVLAEAVVDATQQRAIAESG